MADEILVEGEKAYPIYKFKFEWIENGLNPNPDYPNQNKDLPQGRIKNALHHTIMLREPVSDEELAKQRDEYLARVLAQDKYKDRDIEVTKRESVFVGNETWHLSWFTHETFDVGQTDEEALRSFQNFVSRKECLIEREGETAYCLMGAEDRWRWRGLVTPDDSSNTTDAPCRCTGCKEVGMIRVIH